MGPFFAQLRFLTPQPESSFIALKDYFKRRHTAGD
jgi:hypothetical protein